MSCNKCEILQSKYEEWDSYWQRQSNTTFENEGVYPRFQWACGNEGVYPRSQWALERLWANEGIRSAIETGQEAPLNENID